MGQDTKIEWATHTQNYWIGCTAVSDACDFCYAEARDRRFERGKHWGPHADRRRTSDAVWQQPHRWQKAAARAGRFDTVFCSSLSDVFDNHRSIKPEWRQRMFDDIAATPNLIWLLLTKRPSNVMKMVPAAWLTNGFPRNVAIGTTVENQVEADRRGQELSKIPARWRFLSCEPLLGPVDLSELLYPMKPCGDCPSPNGADPLGCIHPECCREPDLLDPLIQWVIIGGESGPNARPMHKSWVDDILMQCKGVAPAMFKQWGEYAPSYDKGGIGGTHDHQKVIVSPDGSCRPVGGEIMEGEMIMRRFGKKVAGRIIDGHTYDEFPDWSAP